LAFLWREQIPGLKCRASTPSSNSTIYIEGCKVKNKYIPSSQTKGTIKTQKTKDKIITGIKATQMTGQHEPP